MYRPEPSMIDDTLVEPAPVPMRAAHRNRWRHTVIGRCPTSGCQTTDRSAVRRPGDDRTVESVRPKYIEG